MLNQQSSHRWVETPWRSCMSLNRLYGNKRIIHLEQIQLLDILSYYHKDIHLNINQIITKARMKGISDKIHLQPWLFYNGQSRYMKCRHHCYFHVGFVCICIYLIFIPFHKEPIMWNFNDEQTNSRVASDLRCQDVRVTSLLYIAEKTNISVCSCYTTVSKFILHFTSLIATDKFRQINICLNFYGLFNCLTMTCLNEYK